MHYLKCTANVQKALDLPKKLLLDATPTLAPLGNWYVNRCDIGKRMVHVFMSDTTLLSFLLLQGQKPVTVKTLPVMFVGGLAQLLQMRGFGEGVVAWTMAHYHQGQFAKTDSRADLGSLNDLVHRYQWVVEQHGGLAHCDLTRIIMGTNDTPQRRLGWCTSWEAVEAKLPVSC